MPIAVYPDTNTLSQQAAQFIVRLANESIVTHGRFSIALSGGSTPRVLYGLLGSEPYRDQIDWSKVDIFWSDERCVPPDSADSNYHMAQEVLLSRVPLSPQQVHRMPADQPDHDAAAQGYTHEMRQSFGTDGIPRFDLIQLGMGPEGHTASLFPHQASLHEQFTPPILNAARHVLFLVTGAEKADAVQAVLEGDYNPEEYPAQIVRPASGDVVWMLDEAAAGKLKR